ncbi:MAG: hypothetical protein K6T66_05340 [Peptococcaceae bacterium]|nr:hypothetical protein [Peptococcaceae bacterium]
MTLNRVGRGLPPEGGRAVAELPPQLETRCTSCGCPVEDPGTMRCPRCYKPLLLPSCCQAGCAGCAGSRRAAPGKCTGGMS